MKKILYYSQKYGLITFGWEIKLRIKAINNKLYLPIACIIGKINDLQMVIDKELRKLN